jgi:uncharacterized membrane protein YhhN
MVVRSVRWSVCVLIGAVLAMVAMPALVQSAPRVPVVLRNNNFCFDRNIRIGNIVITGNRCYTTYLVNTSSGAFLGFGPAGTPLVAAGQLGQLPPGSAPRGPMLYLLRLNSRVTLPVNTYQFVLPQFVIQNGRLVINVPIAQGQFAVLQADERLPGEQDK